MKKKKKIQPEKQEISIFKLAFLLIAIALLIAVSIYCYLVKYEAKQKQLLPYYITNTKLKRNLH